MEAPDTSARQQPGFAVVHRRGRPRLAASLQTSPRRAHELLRAAIRTGFVSTDRQLVESELVQSLGTSRNAVRQALQMLADEGLVDRSPRRGTSVVGSMVRMTLDQRDAIDRMPNARAHARPAPFTAKLLETRVIAPTPYIRRRMETTDLEVRMYEHLISAVGQPIQVRVGYVLCPFDDDDIHPDEPDRAAAFERRFGRPFGGSEDAIEAVGCEARTSKLLGIPTGSPVLLRETLLVDAAGVPCELSFRYNRGDRVSLCVNHDAPGKRSTDHRTGSSGGAIKP